MIFITDAFDNHATTFGGISAVLLLLAVLVTAIILIAPAPEYGYVAIGFTIAAIVMGFIGLGFKWSHDPRPELHRDLAEAGYTVSVIEQYDDSYFTFREADGNFCFAAEDMSYPGIFKLTCTKEN